jgi:hypothetical protein
MNYQLQRALEDAAWDGDHIAVAALMSNLLVRAPPHCVTPPIGGTGGVSNFPCQSVTPMSGMQRRFGGPPNTAMPRSSGYWRRCLTSAAGKTGCGWTFRPGASPS